MIETNSSGGALSEAFLSAVAQPVVSFDLALLAGGEPLGCEVRRATLTLGTASGAGGDSEGMPLGCALATCLDAELYGLSDPVTGEELEVRVGVDVDGEGAYEYVTVAWVTAATVRTNAAGVTSLRAWGRMASVLAATPLGLPAGAHPAPDVASAIAAQTGLAVETGPFASTGVEVRVGDGWDCRRAASATALALGGFAAETHDGGILLSPLSSTVTTSASPDLLSSLPSLDEVDYEVDGLTVEASEDGSGASFSFGTGRLRVACDGATRADAEALWENVSGFAYRPGTVRLSVLDPRLTPFDVVSVPYGEGSATVPSWGIRATYDGGWFGELDAPGVSADLGDHGSDGPISVRLADVRSDASLAKAYAASAQTSADAAGAAANEAQDSAAAAQASADEALYAARDASSSAIDALTSLSVVEDVVGVVSWAAEHASYVETEDASVVEGKTYYTRSGTGTDEDPYVYTKVDEPRDEDIGSYYEYRIDEELASYVMSHLSLTDQGLWVTMDPAFTLTSDEEVDPDKTYYVLVEGNYVRVDNPVEAGLPNYYERDDGYRMLLSSSGMKVVDGAGNPVATFGESIGFDSNRQHTIGGESSYIRWDGSQLSVVADSITFSGKGLDEALGERDDAIAQVGEDAESAQQTANDAQASADSALAAFKSLEGYVKIEGDSIELGKSSSDLKVKITSERLSFMDDANEVAYASGGEFHAPNMSVNSALKFSGTNEDDEEVDLWAWIPLEDQGLVLKWIG